MPKQWVIEAYRPVWADEWDQGDPGKMVMHWLIADIPTKAGYMITRPPMTLRRCIQAIQRIRKNGPLWDNYRIRNVKTDETIPWEALLG